MRTAVVLWAVLWRLAVGGGVSAADIEIDSVQCRLDRLYFPVGEERQVFRYAPFCITRDDTAIYRGYIEHSWTGTAVSYPTGLFFDSIDTRLLRAVITPAAVDSLPSLVVGISTEMNDLASDLLPPDRARLRSYSDAAVMWEDFADGLLDGVLAFDRSSPRISDSRAISSPLPYVAVLVPNVARHCNDDGRLTTSLFYRFDPKRLDLVWKNEGMVAFEIEQGGLGRLWSHRPYGYAPSTGRSLLTLVKELPPVVRLFCENPSLKPTALFFADILAQDRCRVEIVDRRANADVYIEFVAASTTLPALTVHHLRLELSRESVSGSPAAEDVAQIGRLMQYLATAVSEQDYYRQLELVERKLTEDLGVFPLFYPVYYFHTRPEVCGVDFDANGRPSLDRACRVILPTLPPEEVR